MTGTDTPQFPPELVHLLATASAALDTHVNDHGVCAACGTDWPCERADLAASTLAVL